MPNKIFLQINLALNLSCVLVINNVYKCWKNSKKTVYSVSRQQQFLRNLFIDLHFNGSHMIELQLFLIFSSIFTHL